jgi:hypothetical protein
VNDLDYLMTNGTLHIIDLIQLLRYCFRFLQVAHMSNCRQPREVFTERHYRSLDHLSIVVSCTTGLSQSVSQIT